MSLNNKLDKNNIIHSINDKNAAHPAFLQNI